MKRQFSFSKFEQQAQVFEEYKDYLIQIWDQNKWQAML